MSISTILLPKFQRKRCRHMVFEPCVLFPPCGRLGRIEHMVRSNYSSFFKYCHFRPSNGPRNYHTTVVFVLLFRKIELNSAIPPIICP